MCILCLSEGGFVARGKRPRKDASPPPACGLLRLVGDDGCHVDVSSRALVANCSALPQPAADHASSALPPHVALPGYPASMLGTLADFCQRVSNVGGRDASVNLAWRKSIRPQLDDDDGLCALLLLARRVGATRLRALCAAELAVEVVRAARNGVAALRARFDVEADLDEAQAAEVEADDSASDEAVAAGAPTAMPDAARGGGCALERRLGCDGLEEVLGHVLDTEHDSGGGADALSRAEGCCVAWRAAVRRVLARRRKAEALGLGVSLAEMMAVGAPH